MSREPLPNCRRSITRQAYWEGIPFLLGIGFYDDGRVGEVFVDMKGQLGDTMRDAATQASLGFQFGIDHEAQAKSLGTVPVHEWDAETQAMVIVQRPASPIGVMLAEVAAELAGE